MSEPDPPDRFVALQGAWNLRDLGGYEAAGGARVAWRRLYRADGPDRLTEADAAVVAGLGLGLVLDLRAANENELGTWAHGGARRRPLLIIDALPRPRAPGEPRPPRPPGARKRRLPDTAEGFGAMYLRLLERAAPTVVEGLRELIDHAPTPALFHCSAGKDRTGVFAALVLSLLGVDDEQIVADYALSHRAMAARIAGIAAAPRPDDVIDYARLPEVARGALPDTMRVFLREVAAAYGSLAGWAEAAGFEPADTARLRERLLV
ncbi:MAG: tyrosine-protein phosphatase [Acidimicrobiales bacterium]